MVAVHSDMGNDIPLLSSIDLQCSRCRSSIRGLECYACGFHMEIAEDIVRAMPRERLTRYATFIKDYEHIRAAEGRGSESEEFYLGLPYVDASGKNRAQWQIRGRSYDYLISHVLKEIPRDKASNILDLGAGNCWMSYRLALAGYRPVAVDLLTNNNDGLGAGAHYRSHLPNFFPRFQADAACLPFQNEQFAAIVFNASFHYSEDYEVTLREALRCVRSGGIVIISDTPWYSREKSGEEMVAERHATFLRNYGTASDSIKSIQYLTDDRLRALEKQLAVKWTVYSPDYGIKWAMRPLMAKLRNKREPSRFRIYTARRDAFGKS